MSKSNSSVLQARNPCRPTKKKVQIVGLQISSEHKRETNVNTPTIRMEGTHKVNRKKITGQIFGAETTGQLIIAVIFQHLLISASQIVCCLSL